MCKLYKCSIYDLNHTLIDFQICTSGTLRTFVAKNAYYSDSLIIVHIEPLKK